MQKHSVLGLFIAFAVLALVFGVLEQRFAAIERVSIWRRDRLTDFTYWLFAPLVTRALTGIAIAGMAFFAAVLLGLPAGRESLVPALQARSPLSQQPAWLQLIEALR